MRDLLLLFGMTLMAAYGCRLMKRLDAFLNSTRFVDDDGGRER